MKCKLFSCLSDNTVTEKAKQDILSNIAATMNDEKEAKTDGKPGVKTPSANRCYFTGSSFEIDVLGDPVTNLSIQHLQEKTNSTVTVDEKHFPLSQYTPAVAVVTNKNELKQIASDYKAAKHAPTENIACYAHQCVEDNREKVLLFIMHYQRTQIGLHQNQAAHHEWKINLKKIEIIDFTLLTINLANKLTIQEYVEKISQELNQKSNPLSAWVVQVPGGVPSQAVLPEMATRLK